MFKFHFQATIQRPVADVWSLLTDIKRYPEWMPVEDPRMLSGSSDAPGGRMRMVMKPMSRRWDMEFEIVEAEPQRRIVWRVVSGGSLRGDYRAELEPSGPSATSVTYSGELRLTGGWRVLEPLIAMEVRKGESRELERMKEVLESAPAPHMANAETGRASA